MNLTPETEETQPPKTPGWKFAKNIYFAIFFIIILRIFCNCIDFEVFLQNRALEKVKSLRSNNEKLQILLALDGGGIRGLILVTVKNAVSIR